MTLQDFIAKYDGKVVADGQCGNLVRAYWNEVDHTTPPSYPNSKDYWFNPVPGYIKSQTPIPGAIAIYNGHGIYTEGHSAIYYDGRVFEQNADPDGSPAHLYNRSNTYLLGYLIKEEIMAGVKIQGAPAAVSWGTDRIDIVAAGTDGKLYHKWFSGQWNDWENLTDKYQVGMVSGDITMSSWGDNRLDIFFTGSGGDLVHIYFDGKWGGPESLGQPK